MGTKGKLGPIDAVEASAEHLLLRSTHAMVAAL